MDRPNWRQVADALAERMEHQAYRCPEDHEPRQPDVCPFCADTTAYESYLTAAGRKRAVYDGLDLEL